MPASDLERIADAMPPQSLECEQAVLGCMLIEEKAIDAASKLLKFTDFYREIHGTIFAAICSLHRQGVPVDLLSLQERLRSKNLLEEIGTPYLATLMDAPTTCAHIEYYAGVVKDKSLRRQWADAFLGAAASMWTSEDDFPAIWEDVGALVKQVDRE